MPYLKYSWVYICTLVPISLIVFSWWGHKHHEIKKERKHGKKVTVSGIRRLQNLHLGDSIKGLLSKVLEQILRKGQKDTVADEEAVPDDSSSESDGEQQEGQGSEMGPDDQSVRKRASSGDHSDDKGEQNEGQE